jgi:hypothetical protein
MVISDKNRECERARDNPRPPRNLTRPPAPNMQSIVDWSNRNGRGPIHRGPSRLCPFREPVAGAERAARTLG